MALNLFGISIPTPSLPSLPSLPKIEVPKISIPTPSLPKIEVPKISIPTPSLPKIEVPKISIPTPSLPKVELPKVELPKVELPKIEVPKVELPKVELPKVELPDLAGAAGGVSRWYDDVIKARDQSYDAGIEHIAAGDVGRGGLQFGGTMAADVLLPMDLGDAVNKWVTGRGDQIDGELALWAAIDAVSLAAAPLTFGASYAAGRALKAGKLAKAAKIAESTKVGGEVAKSSAFGKLGSLLTGAGKSSSIPGKAASNQKLYQQVFEQAARTAKQQQAAAKAAQQTAYSKQFAKFERAVQQQQAKIASQIRKQQQSITSQIAKQQAKLSERMAEVAAKFKAPTKGLDTAADLAKAESRWGKTSSALGGAAKATGLVGLGLGAGAIGLTMMGGAGGPAPAPGPEEEEEELPQWLIDLLSGGAGAEGSPWIDDGVPPPELDWSSLLSMGGLDFPYGDFIYPDGLGGYTDAYGYYPAAYPDLFGLEGLGQDMCGYLEDIPGVGGVYEGAKRRGLGIPAIVGTIVLVILIVAFLRSKKGKKMIAGAKKKVGGAKKKVTG